MGETPCLTCEYTAQEAANGWNVSIRLMVPAAR